ncbi:hypothetical protein GYMLUDRAFT_175444 [Collybiopsis luxurians FD-317 M1]|uniref:Uncharacterized protein n=1 Tax=Collybiopsis luxurians FD-317 M1 TaxID=944289 RepID=A0A0D0CBY7_9AGAR|nr:hypothetical protein GYMLUDRAFT_175444 [Collybiopsis luxurians FD-317 M1]
MDSLPLDTSHPAVRQYLALIRLQVLTPLSLLINIAAVIVCSVLVTPSIGDVSRRFPTSISPRPVIIAIYVAAIYAGQLGYCVLIVLARKAETKPNCKSTVTKVGLSLVVANWVMALWTVAWVFEWFLLSTILQGILLLTLIYANLVLLIYHPPTSARPFDTMLIHAPLRFFLVLQFGLMFPLSLFINLGLTYTPITPGPPRDYAEHPWPGFGVVLGTNLLGLIVVILRRDIVWCVSATWICVSIWALKPKPGPVFVVAILFTVLHPLALIGTYIYSAFYKRRGITLPPEDDALYGRSANGRVAPSAPQPESNNGPREVNEDEVWG